MVRLLIVKNALVGGVKKFLTRKEEGASMVEYGLLVALIAVACVASTKLLGQGIDGIFQQAIAGL
jgi:pilus assembly protein Flp/PilA